VSAKNEDRKAKNGRGKNAAPVLILKVVQLQVAI